MAKKESINKICENKVFLLETLSADHDLILQHVQQAKLITQNDYMKLADIPEREKRIINLLDKLMGKGEKTCCQFIDLLKKDCILEIFPALKDHASFCSPVQEIPQYKIAQIPRGICIIINNVNFTMAMSERMGSDEDQNYLAKVFRWLGFEVVVHRDKTAAEMKNLLEDLGTSVDGDCFVCCVLSHGIKEGVIGTDGGVVSVDEIRKPFTGITCQSLAGKPKLFFIQASRSKMHLEMHYSGLDATKDGESEMKVDTDFLISWAVTDGQLAFRNRLTGSLFIQSLCRNLEKHCPLGTDIQTILLYVNDEVSSSEEIKCLNSKQMPVHEVALRKKLILQPVNHSMLLHM